MHSSWSQESRQGSCRRRRVEGLRTSICGCSRGAEGCTIRSSSLPTSETPSRSQTVQDRAFPTSHRDGVKASWGGGSSSGGGCSRTPIACCLESSLTVKRSPMERWRKRAGFGMEKETVLPISVVRRPVRCSRFMSSRRPDTVSEDGSGRSAASATNPDRTSSWCRMGGGIVGGKGIGSDGLGGTVGPGPGWGTGAGTSTAPAGLPAIISPVRTSIPRACCRMRDLSVRLDRP